MASDQNRAELDARTRQGGTVIPGSTGGKTLEAQEHLAEGNDSVSNIYFLLYQSVLTSLMKNQEPKFPQDAHFNIIKHRICFFSCNIF